MNTALSELKKADPALKHNEAFKKAMEMWKVRFVCLARCVAFLRFRGGGLMLSKFVMSTGGTERQDGEVDFSACSRFLLFVSHRRLFSSS